MVFQAVGVGYFTDCRGAVGVAQNINQYEVPVQSLICTLPASWSSRLIAKGVGNSPASFHSRSYAGVVGAVSIRRLPRQSAAQAELVNSTRLYKSAWQVLSAFL